MSGGRKGVVAGKMAINTKSIKDHNHLFFCKLHIVSSTIIHYICIGNTLKVSPSNQSNNNQLKIFSNEKVIITTICSLRTDGLRK
jgi:repressor of nif and glnA expression